MALAEAAKVYPYESWMRLEDIPPPVQFPKKGLPEEEVMKLIKERLANDVPPEKNFYIFGVDAHPFSKRVFNMSLHSYQVGFAKDIFPGTYQMAQEAIRMIGSLFGAKDPAGFLTPGGTESNLCGVRLARNLGRKRKPELVKLETGHYSFNLAGELFGVKVNVADVNPDLTPKMDQVEDLINENTVMLTCTTPEGSLGVVDPVKEFAELAEKHGIYFHVDAAVGGFMLPFMRELGYKIPEFDFRIPQVNSMTADPHKLGMQQKPTSSFIIRDRAYLKAIPVEQTFIPYLSGSSRLGASAVSLWALIRHLGMDGYKRYIKNAMDLTMMIAREVEDIQGLKVVREPVTTVVGIASEKYDIRKVEKRIAAKGWVTPVGTLPHTETSYIRIFVHPLKTKEIVEKYLSDLRAAVKAVKAKS